VDELFVPRAEVKLPGKKEDFAAWKAGLVKQLREKSFRALPEKVQPGVILKKEGLFRLVSSEEGIVFLVVLDMSLAGKDHITLAVLNPNESGEAVKNWVDTEQYRKDTVVWSIVAPRGGLGLHWTTKNPPNTVERSLALLGQSVDSGRVRDIASMQSGPKKNEKEKVPTKTRITGRGQAGIIAAYATILGPGGVDEVVILDPPASHRDGPHFLNVERVLDLPTALGLLAPDVKLTLINAKDKAFDKTAAIYKLAGAEAKFERK
jgi:hypothetical protein